MLDERIERSVMLFWLGNYGFKHYTHQSLDSLEFIRDHAWNCIDYFGHDYLGYNNCD